MPYQVGDRVREISTQKLGTITRLGVIGSVGSVSVTFDDNTRKAFFLKTIDQIELVG